MADYRIFQNKQGFHIQEDKGTFNRRPYYYEENWVTQITAMTLEEARRVKENMEITQGRVVE